ncbi:hypothetical protein [Paenarthrobacter nitroguajacolicus]|uniref:hypothetical protein n=1 Tax=Paenarthrobacter nitroguajacolicus TaxID=211146 RepID=UPI000AB0C638|nr:hypothetical protein [Paenarthrobacter nitroguajacolicus]
MEGLTFLDGFRDDIKTLVRQGQAMALQLLVDVSQGKTTGLPLDDNAKTGDLSDCFKIYFDHDPAFTQPNEMRFRLVYRLLEDGKVQAATVEAVAVGPRRDLEAYRRAAKNLGR